MMQVETSKTSSMLTNKEIDEAYSQPSKSGLGKSRYDIAREIETAVIEKLKQHGHIVFRFGDGVNNQEGSIE